MSEVPKDVIAAGDRYAELFGDGRQGYAAFDIAVLAIMEERERCWAIADKECGSHSTGSGFDSQPARQAAFSIREAIAAPKGEA